MASDLAMGWALGRCRLLLEALGLALPCETHGCSALVGGQPVFELALVPPRRLARFLRFFCLRRWSLLLIGSSGPRRLRRAGLARCCLETMWKWQG